MHTKTDANRVFRVISVLAGSSARVQQVRIIVSTATAAAATATAVPTRRPRDLCSQVFARAFRVRFRAGPPDR